MKSQIELQKEQLEDLNRKNMEELDKITKTNKVWENFNINN